jgi:anti-sigma B factor antagonist
MTGRAGCIVGDKAAPDGGIEAMGATAVDLVRAGGSAHETQLEFRYQRTADGNALVSARGELDIATAGYALTYLRTVLEGEKKKGRVTLNLAELTFCDAAGLGVLARAAGYARQAGRSLRLASPRPALVRIMRITGMDSAFPEVRTPVLTMVPATATTAD